MNNLLRKSVLAFNYLNSAIFFGSEVSKTVYSGKRCRPTVWSQGQGWGSNNNQVKECCVKPGRGPCLSRWLRNWNILPCVNVEVNELSSVLCRAWKNTNAVLACFLKANPECQSVSALRATVKEKRANVHRLWEIPLKWKKIRAVDFYLLKVTYPFGNVTKATDPSSPLPPCLLQSGHPQRSPLATGISGWP